MTAHATAPSPDLAPSDVVLAQLAALQSERYPTDLAALVAGPGVEAAWQFASPGNRAATGPLPRFAALLQAPLYRGLLGHRAVTLGPLVELHDEAQQEALVLTADDTTVGFTWVLGRQVDEPYAGCWMTEGVLRHPDAS